MRPIILSLSVLVLLAACKKEPTGPEDKTIPRQQSWTIQWDGRARTCLVYLPSGWNEKTALPVVFNLHGYSSSAAGQRDYTRTHVLGDNVGYITVYPDGALYIGNTYSDQGWNCGISENPVYPTVDTDDVGFISKIIDSLIVRFVVDTTRIYACGWSNGGMMSLMLAGRISKRIAAVASVAGIVTNSTARSYQRDRPVPLMMINGTSDSYVYNGAPGWLSVDSTLSFLRDVNQCTNPPDTTVVPDSDLFDGSTAVKVAYYSPTNVPLMVFFKIIGGGTPGPGPPGIPKRTETSMRTSRFGISSSSFRWRHSG